MQWIRLGRCMALAISVATVGIGTTVVAQSKYAVKTLATFNNTNGSLPGGGLVMDAGGNLFGVTKSGGANNDGTVYEIAAGTHALNTVATFNGANGTEPFGSLLIDSSGNLFGTTFQGATGNYGTIFEIDSATHTLSTIVTFDRSNGAGPTGNLIADGSGNLFGTTQVGGANDEGTVFEVANDAGHTLSTLATFNSSSTGLWPFAPLAIDKSGNLYGTTYYGPVSQSGIDRGNGFIFKISGDTHTLSTVAAFNGTNGSNPAAGLIIDSNGNLFGTTKNGGGTNMRGTVFEVAAGTQTIMTLVIFNNKNGADPQSKLLIDANGNLYGTTGVGGPKLDGTAFELYKNGGYTLSNMNFFNGTNGESPAGALFADSNGNFFGATEQGGPVNAGTVFELSPAQLGDLNLDASVDAKDISTMLAVLTNRPLFEQNNLITDAQLLSIGDLNGDGAVNNADLQKLLDVLKSGGGSIAAVPEPSTQILAAGLVAIIAIKWAFRPTCPRPTTM